MGDQFDSPLEEHGAARHTDPDTSHEAAESVNPASVHWKIVQTFLKARGGTIFDSRPWLITHEISYLSEIGYWTVTPRMTEMVKKGLVEDTGQRRVWAGAPGISGTGRQSIIWRLRDPAAPPLGRPPQSKRTKRTKAAKKRIKADKNGQERPKVDSRQLSLFPPGLQQEMLGVCAACGQSEWVHSAYWREAFIGADHEFQPQEAS